MKTRFKPGESLAEAAVANRFEAKSRSLLAAAREVGQRLPGDAAARQAGEALAAIGLTLPPPP